MRRDYVYWPHLKPDWSGCSRLFLSQWSVRIFILFCYFPGCWKHWFWVVVWTGRSETLLVKRVNDSWLPLTRKGTWSNIEELIMEDRGTDRVSGEDRNTTALAVSTPDEVLGWSSDKRAEQVDGEIKGRSQTSTWADGLNGTTESWATAWFAKVIKAK